jgi:O-antigen polysaccharide polymerase Wzy
MSMVVAADTKKHSIIAASLFTMIFVSSCLSLYESEIFKVLPYLLFFLFCLFLIHIRQGIFDPFVVLCWSTLFYGFVPLLAEKDEFVVQFGTDGAYYIYTIAINALCFSFIVLDYVSSETHVVRTRGGDDKNDAVTFIAMILCAAVSIFLETLYYAQHGSVVVGELDYLEGFRARGETGSGIFLLSSPLALAGVSFLLTSKYRDKLFAYIICLAPFALLYFVHSERKYVLAPLLVIAARQIKIRNISSMAAASIGAAFVWLIFSYFGYLRIRNYGVADAFNVEALNGFLFTIGYEIGAETPTIYATASAAYLEFIKPLPFLGDYLLSWQLALPQFIFGNGLFVSTGDRFAINVNPDTAALGMGYGFSFWGEAYLVGGTSGVVLVAFGMAYLARVLFERGMASGVSGPRGAILIASIYYAHWMNRNDFAHFLKEFLIYYVVVILFMYKFSQGVYSLWSGKR